jgi:low temperature requirement protein LtrA
MQKIGCLMFTTGFLILLSFVLPFIGIPLLLILILGILISIPVAIIQKRKVNQK